MSLPSEPVHSDLTTSHDAQIVKVDGVPQNSDTQKTEASTPPSSPPIYQEEMSLQSQEMPPPAAPASKTRKRSRGEADVTINVPDSSATPADDFDPFASQDDEQSTTTDSAATIKQNQRQIRSSQPAPPSAQNTRTTAQPKKTSKSGPSQQAQQESRNDENEGGSDETTASNDPGLPEDPLEEYDWNELENRYHDRLAEQHEREQAIFDHLGKLVAVILSALSGLLLDLTMA